MDEDHQPRRRSMPRLSTSSSQAVTLFTSPPWICGESAASN
ncbi:hypothetical protein CsSME_00020091 [Camellia sinensis var. sinensis]